MKQELVMDQKPIAVKSAGVKFTVNNNGKSQGAIVVSGTRVKWFPKGQSAHGFELGWENFAAVMVGNGKKF